MALSGSRNVQSNFSEKWKSEVSKELTAVTKTLLLREILLAVQEYPPPSPPHYWKGSLTRFLHLLKALSSPWTRQPPWPWRWRRAATKVWASSYLSPKFPVTMPLTSPSLWYLYLHLFDRYQKQKSKEQLNERRAGLSSVLLLFKQIDWKKIARKDCCQPGESNEVRRAWGDGLPWLQGRQHSTCEWRWWWCWLIYDDDDDVINGDDDDLWVFFFSYFSLPLPIKILTSDWPQI